ncbi:MAG: hypothetical protein ISS47_03085 [Candidatus Omnitrophica bacterium]|nr:hypothetical protein [Candidatus Omnitrophota bacterium]
MSKNIYDIRIQDLNLSIRSKNCFYDVRIKTIGDLVKKTGMELLQYRNLGAKSLKEINSVLDSFGLHLRTSSIREELKVNNINVPESILKMPIDELDLSVRSHNCLRKARIKTVEQLIKKTDLKLLRYKNFGKKCLVEIKTVLGKLGLCCGMLYAKDSSERYNIVKEEDVKQCSSIQEWLIYFKNEFIENDGINKIIKNRRNLKIFIKWYGLNQKPQTLREIAKQMSITRERVRQIATQVPRSLYKALKNPYKDFLNKFVLKFKENQGLLIFEEDENILNSYEFSFFNIILSIINDEIKFNQSARLWEGSKLDKQIKKIKKYLDIRCDYGSSFSKNEITNMIKKCYTNIDLSETYLEAIFKIVVSHQFRLYNNKYFYKRVLLRTAFEEIIKDSFPKGVAIYKDINSFLAIAKKQGFQELFKNRNKRHLINVILHSKNIILWDWGVYIHKENISVDKSVLKETRQWLSANFKSGITRVSMWGAFSKFKDDCYKCGIFNEHALYSCMKMQYEDRYSFIRDPFVYPKDIKVGIGRIKHLENYLYNYKKGVQIKEILTRLGLKRYQLNDITTSSSKILYWGPQEIIHIDNIKISHKEDLEHICEYITSKIKRFSHINIMQIYQDQIVLCKKNNIPNSKAIYSVAIKYLGNKLFFPRYPYILTKDHGIEDDGIFSYNDIVNHFFVNKKDVVSHQELFSYFVKERGYPSNYVANIKYICDNIIEYAKGSYVSLETINWSDEKKELLERIANNKFNEKITLGHPFVKIDELLEQDLPPIGEFTKLVWQRTLLKELLERIDSIKLLGNMKEVYVIVPNKYRIETTEDLLFYFLKNKFSGAINKDKFIEFLNNLKIAKTIRDYNKYKKFKVVNEEVIITE